MNNEEQDIIDTLKQLHWDTLIELLSQNPHTKLREEILKELQRRAGDGKID